MSLLVDGRKALFGNLIDFAGMFPPASLDTAAAVAGYRSARNGPHAWMLGRFLCPASRLEELAAVLTATMTAGEPPWSVGAIFDGPGAVEAATSFHRHMTPGAEIGAVELRTPPEAVGVGKSVEDAIGLLAPLADAAASVSPTVTPYLEIVRTDTWATSFRMVVDAIAELSKRRLRPIGAKLRTGGLDAAAFPTPEQVARFITACAAREVPFKFTAGLHHPIRHRWVDLDVMGLDVMGLDVMGLDVMRHGFLNLLVAAALAVEGADETVLVAAIAEEDPEAFGVGPAGVTWAGRRIGVSAVRRSRGSLFPAYGSCSFDEPVDDLVALGILESR